MPEISEAKLAELEGALRLLHQLNAKPEARQYLEKSIKIVNPEVETGDDVAARIAAPYVAQIEALKTDFTKFADETKAEKAAAAERQAQADTDSAFSRLRTAGYTEDGVEKIKGLMVDRKIADPEAAAALFDKLNPPAQIDQPGWAPSSWGVESTADKGIDVAALFKDEDRWADQEAGRVLASIRNGQG